MNDAAQSVSLVPAKLLQVALEAVSEFHYVPSCSNGARTENESSRQIYLRSKGEMST